MSDKKNTEKKDENTRSILVLECNVAGFNELHEGWEHFKECGMNITFNKYLFAMLMLGHNTAHKVIGMMSIMSEYVEDDEEDDDQ